MENGRQTTWQRTRTQIVAVGLIAYWTALCLGTHLPGGVVVAPPVSDKLLHFAAYLSARTHDTRATLWTIGSLMLVYMTVRTLVATLAG